MVVVVVEVHWWRRCRCMMTSRNGGVTVASALICTSLCAETTSELHCSTAKVSEFAPRAGRAAKCSFHWTVLELGVASASNASNYHVKAAIAHGLRTVAFGHFQPLHPARPVHDIA